MSLLLLAAAGLFLAGAAGALLWLCLRPGDAELERRLRRVAEALSGQAAGGDEAQAAVFRRRPAKSWLYDWIERRFAMLGGRKAFPKAAALGLVAAVVAVAAVAFMQLGPFVAFLTLPVAWAAVSRVLLAFQDSRTRSRFVKQFPEIVDHVVRLTQAGLPAVDAVSVVSREAPEPVRGILRQVSDEVASGLDPEAVLRGVAARIRIPEFTLFAAAICLQRNTGGSIATALGNLSTTLRDRLEMDLKAQSATAQTRLTLMVLSGVPLLVLGAQSLTNPEALDMLFDSPALLRWGVGLVVAGLLIARGIAARFGR